MKFTTAVSTALLALGAIAAPQCPGCNHGGILSFGGRLTIAQRSVEAWGDSSSVELLYATVASDNGKPASDTWGLNRIEAKFIASGTSEYTIKEKSWGEFEKPKHITDFFQGVDGAKTFKLPVKVDLDEAEKNFRKATGSKAQIESVDLSWRITRDTLDQPYYFFSLADGTSAAVGANDGKLAGDNN